MCYLTHKSYIWIHVLANTMYNLHFLLFAPSQIGRELKIMMNKH